MKTRKLVEQFKRLPVVVKLLLAVVLGTIGGSVLGYLFTVLRISHLIKTGQFID